MRIQMGPRAGRWLKLLATFFTAQTLIQGINLTVGFLLLRWMSFEAYAQYSVANAFQSMLNIFVDLGFSGSIVTLVGSRIDKPEVIGTYIHCARVFRGRMFFVVGLVSAVVFPFVVSNQPWPPLTKFLLWAAVMCGLFFTAWNIYAAPLLMHRRLGPFYQAQIVPASLRLAGFGLLHGLGALTGWIASWLNAASTLVGGWQYRRASKGTFIQPEKVDREALREMRRFLAPLWPGMIFYVFQAQITVALISIFGGTQNIAEVAALGRLGQLFMLLSALNTVLIEPFVARRTKGGELRAVALVAALALLTAGAITAVGYLLPGPFLWLLGPNYRQLSSEIGLMIASASLSWFSGTLFVVCTARRWVDWAASVYQIAGVILAQVATVLLLPPRTTHAAVVFGFVTASAATIMFATTIARGLLRKTPKPEASNA